MRRDVSFDRSEGWIGMDGMYFMSRSNNIYSVCKFDLDGANSLSNQNGKVRMLYSYMIISRLLGSLSSTRLERLTALNSGVSSEHCASRILAT